jgi:hypothetical protein
MNSTKGNFDRRRFLKSAAVILALPSLESYASTKVNKNPKAKAVVTIGTHLGWYRKGFYPEKAGYDYDMPELLKPIESHRKDFTIFSGLDHRAPNGHPSWTNFLCGKKPKSHSLDQIIADKVGQKSRFPSIRLTAGAGESSSTMSFTKRGTPLPVIQRPSILYKQLFLSKADVKLSEYMLKSNKSALDFVLEDARRLQKSVSKNDAEKLDEYFESMRSVEKRLNQKLSSINDPIATTDYKLPNYDPITPNLQMEASALMYDLMALAIQTESTKVLSLYIHGLGQVFSIGGAPLKTGYHGLTHHGNDPVMIRDLMKIEKTHFKCLNGFLSQLKEKKDAEGNALLDSTIVLVGTGMGDASRHDNSDLPTLIAGGGFKHGRHLHNDRKSKDSLLLGDLYISMQQQMGIETDSFSNASRNFNHLLV